MIYWVGEGSSVIGCLGVEVECNGLSKLRWRVEKERRGGQLFAVMLARQLELAKEKSHWSRQYSSR